jgi:phage baseplate assembly protein W
MAIHDSIIGTGFAFPLMPDSSGRLGYVTGEDAIEQSLAVLLQTWLKERVMRPDFGSSLREQLFAPGSERSLRLLEQSVRVAIRDHEARIEVDNIAASTDPRDQTYVLIEIAYRIRATYVRGNLVFPFYMSGVPGLGAA